MPSRPPGFFTLTPARKVMLASAVMALAIIGWLFWQMASRGQEVLDDVQERDQQQYRHGR